MATGNTLNEAAAGNSSLADLWTALCCVLMLWLLALHGSRAIRTHGRPGAPGHDGRQADGKRAASVPFFYQAALDAEEAEAPFAELARAVEGCQRDADGALSSLARAHDAAQKTEWMVFPEEEGDGIPPLGAAEAAGAGDPSLLSSKLRERIASTAEILESNRFVLEHILKPIPFVQGLPLPAASQTCDTATEEAIDSGLFRTDDHVSSYDSASQVITHIVRDWSDLGADLRHSLYDWCIHQLRQYATDTSSSSSTVTYQTPVLVPGAGLARLPHDMATAGFTVEANEISLVMAAAAYRFLHRKANGTVHPFAMDYLTNEVHSYSRYQKVSFPDGAMLRSEPHPYNGSLSYTVGDFVQTYATTYNKGRYASVVTCFFIDTATNIYEYILVIRNVLQDGGVWVNVGPLQWHQNAKLHPSADELRSMISRFGFVIKMWEVDKTPVNYRNNESNNNPRFTKFEGYRPLRFVAVLPSRDDLKLQSENVLQKIIDIRRFFRPRKQHDSKTRENTEYIYTRNSSLVIEDISE